MIKTKCQIECLNGDVLDFYSIIDNQDFEQTLGVKFEKENIKRKNILEFLMHQLSIKKCLLGSFRKNEIISDTIINWNSVKYLELIKFEII